MKYQLVLGSGPVGSSVATLLANQGSRVKLVSRSGKGPSHENIFCISRNISDSEWLSGFSRNCDTIYNCINPAYTRWTRDWPPMHRAIMAAAQSSGAVLVVTDNFYPYSSDSKFPIVEGAPACPVGSKGRIRAEMMRDILVAHNKGELKATFARASDFIGPGVRISRYGEKLIRSIFASTKVSVLGGLDKLHSVSFVHDVARTLVAIGSDRRAWGHVWHVPNAPAVSQRELLTRLSIGLGRTVEWSEIGRRRQIAKALLSKYEREVLEIAWQFQRDFVVSSGETERVFSLAATSLNSAISQTVAWWTAQLGT